MIVSIKLIYCLILLMFFRYGDGPRNVLDHGYCPLDLPAGFTFLYFTIICKDLYTFFL